MNSSGGSLPTRLPIRSGIGQAAVRSFGGFHTLSGIACTKGTRSSLLAFTGDAIRGWLAPVRATAPSRLLKKSLLVGARHELAGS